MKEFRILDPDPYNNSTGSASLPLAAYLPVPSSGTFTLNIPFYVVSAGSWKVELIFVLVISEDVPEYPAGEAG